MFDYLINSFSFSATRNRVNKIVYAKNPYILFQHTFSEIKRRLCGFCPKAVKDICVVFPVVFSPLAIAIYWMPHIDCPISNVNLPSAL